MKQSSHQRNRRRVLWRHSTHGVGLLTTNGLHTDLSFVEGSNTGEEPVRDGILGGIGWA